VSIPNPNNALKVGMFANAEIGGQIRNRVLAIPEGSLVMREDQKTVFVVREGNTVMQRVLKLGDAAGGWVEVREGLQEGDRIVVTGQHKLKDGTTIRLGTPEGQQPK
jgi:RND family efflux transporter MFP subunit